ncbi:MAG: glycosyltransferase family 4 protein [Pseudomonadota bacterium]
MRIAIVDYSGHAFPIQLSRALAGKGHDVLHLHFSEFQSPHGRLEKHADDSTNLTVQPVSLGRPFPKYSLFKRRFEEIKIGKAFAATISAFGPDIVVACNCPLDCALQIGKSALKSNQRFVFWQQDIYSVAIRKILGRRFGGIGQAIGAYYNYMEKRIISMSHATIVISPDFLEAIEEQFALSTGNVHVIENWAPLGEIPVCAKSNPWSSRHGLADKKVILYSGTIGLKHDPQQILDLAQSLRHEPDTKIVVISEGPFADWLSDHAKAAGLDNIMVLPFQPFADFPNVLGTADVAIALLESDAGTYSVPSKVLSYLCAGRPIVLSAPCENLAARIVTQSNAGVIVAAGSRTDFVAAVSALIGDAAQRATAGSNARAYAERMFDIEQIACRFETIFKTLPTPSAPLTRIQQPVPSRIEPNPS